MALLYIKWGKTHEQDIDFEGKRIFFSKWKSLQESCPKRKLREWSE